jgi:hypothetical protein
MQFAYRRKIRPGDILFMVLGIACGGLIDAYLSPGRELEHTVPMPFLLENLLLWYKFSFQISQSHSSWGGIRLCGSNIFASARFSVTYTQEKSQSLLYALLLSIATAHLTTVTVFNGSWRPLQSIKEYT